MLVIFSTLNQARIEYVNLTVSPYLDERQVQPASQISRLNLGTEMEIHAHFEAILTQD